MSGGVQHNPQQVTAGGTTCCLQGDEQAAAAGVALSSRSWGIYYDTPIGCGSVKWFERHGVHECVGVQEGPAPEVCVVGILVVAGALPGVHRGAQEDDHKGKGIQQQDPVRLQWQMKTGMDR
jgi:hypothetical protein